MIEDLRSRRLSTADFPPIRVARIDAHGIYVTADNRRLYCFQHARIDKIPVRVTSLSEDCFTGKCTGGKLGDLVGLTVTVVHSDDVDRRPKGKPAREFERMRYFHEIGKSHGATPDLSPNDIVSAAWEGAGEPESKQPEPKGSNQEMPPSMDDDDVPDEFVCPISMELIEEPVMAADGHTYEKRHIEDWLGRNLISPKTGKELASTTLVPNWNLRKAISNWKELRSSSS